VGSEKRIFSARVRIGHSRSFKVRIESTYAFSEQSVKRVLGLSWTVSDILQVFCSWPRPYSTRILGVFPLDQIANVGVSPSIYVKLISREFFSRYIPTCVKNIADRKTHGQTDDFQWHNRALHSIVGYVKPPS